MAVDNDQYLFHVELTIDVRARTNEEAWNKARRKCLSLHGRANWLSVNERTLTMVEINEVTPE